MDEEDIDTEKQTRDRVASLLGVKNFGQDEIIGVKHGHYMRVRVDVDRIGRVKLDGLSVSTFERVLDALKGYGDGKTNGS